MSEKVGTVAARYKQLATFRESFTAVAEAAALLTIPSLFPPVTNRQQHKRNAGRLFEAKTPWQNTGSRGVSNLSAKMLLALFPPNIPFFKFLIAEDLLAQIGEDPDLLTEIELALSKMSLAVMNDIEASGMRVDLYESLRQLVVTGNALLHVPVEGALRVFDLGEYVVKRNRQGDVLEIIVEESVDPQAAEERIAAIISEEVDQKENKDRQYHLYTRVVRDGGSFKVSQEILGRTIPGSMGNHPVDRTPWLALRFRKVEGEDYGRGLVEEVIGDLKSLESLTKSIVQGAAASAKLLFGVRPGSAVDVRNLARKENGEFFDGQEGDVWALQLNKHGDFGVAKTTADQIKESLSFIFLLNSAIQRNGERVTAEEIRFLAGELEDALGGVYSILSQELQLPLIRRLRQRLEKRREIPSISNRDLKTAVVTGIEAIGRGHDVTRLRGLADDISVLAKAAPALLQNIDFRQFLLRLAEARGVETKGLIKTPDQVANEQQAAQQQQLKQQAIAVAVEQGLGAGAQRYGEHVAEAAAKLQPGQIPGLASAGLPTGGTNVPQQ
jgi:Autographiviridae portal protein